MVIDKEIIYDGINVTNLLFQFLIKDPLDAALKTNFSDIILYQILLLLPNYMRVIPFIIW